MICTLVKQLSIFFLLILALPDISLLANKAPMKYGDVSLDDLKMATYDADTSAAAVILCEYGYFSPNDFRFTRLIRIKILKKAGYSWANMTFPSSINAEVKGITFNLENGKPVETKLASRDIYEEYLYRNEKRIRIAMPNVKIGSVVDIQFTFNGIPDSWEFQKEIPVKYSELVMESNTFVTFRKYLSGFEPLKQNEDGHWIAENMPAFKIEPYTSSPKNYVANIEFDIAEIHYNRFYQAIATSWDAICKYLDENMYFGIPLRDDGYMNKAAKEINLKAKTDKEKIMMAHDYIKKYRWNKVESLYTSESNIKWSLDKKSGNSADINLALVQLLRKIGLKATPILLSTRDNGFIAPDRTSLNKLNYVIAQVDLNGEKLLIDGTEENAPYDLLPDRDLNFFGRTYNTRYSDAVELKTNKKAKSVITYKVILEDDLNLVGTMNFLRTDYAALAFRNKYKTFAGQEPYLENMLEEFPGLRIGAATIANIDSVYLPVKDQYDITLKNLVEEMNGNFYLYPMLLHRLRENPFKLEKRSYPVDFIHQVDDLYAVNITLPENVEVVSFPKAINMGLPDKAAFFLYQVTIMGNSIQFNYKMGINKVIFAENEYNDLKEFYNQIIAKHAEPIILRRK